MRVGLRKPRGLPECHLFEHILFAAASRRVRNNQHQEKITEKHTAAQSAFTSLPKEAQLELVIESKVSQMMTCGKSVPAFRRLCFDNEEQQALSRQISACKAKFVKGLGKDGGGHRHHRSLPRRPGHQPSKGKGNNANDFYPHFPNKGKGKGKDKSRSRTPSAHNNSGERKQKGKGKGKGKQDPRRQAKGVCISGTTAILQFSPDEQLCLISTSTTYSVPTSSRARRTMVWSMVIETSHRAWKLQAGLRPVSSLK